MTDEWQSRWSKPRTICFLSECAKHCDKSASFAEYMYNLHDPGFHLKNHLHMLTNYNLYYCFLILRYISKQKAVGITKFFSRLYVFLFMYSIV